MADFEYSAKLNIEDILSGVVKVDKATENMAKNMDASFKKAGKSISGLFIDTQGRVREANGRFSSMGEAIRKAGEHGQQAGQKTTQAFQESGARIGLVSGVVSALTTEFIRLGERGIQALIDIGKQSINTALEVDTLKARLGGIFDDNKEAADQAFTFIQDKSKELGINLSELAGAFIPKTESLAQFERVAKVATALARSDPEQGAIGARIALLEALSGTFTSLQRRFEIPKEDINRIKEAFDTQGIEGFISTLEKILAESGKSFDDFADTASTSFAKLGIAGEQLGGRLGTPIVEALQRASEKILDFIDTNEDDIIVFVDTIGQALGSIIDFIGNIDFSKLDIEQAQELANILFNIVDDLKAFGTLLGELDWGEGFISDTQNIATKLDEALRTALKLSIIVGAEVARKQAEVEVTTGLDLEQLNKDLEEGKLSFTEYLSAVYEVNKAALGFGDSQASAAAGQKAYNETIQKGLSVFDELDKSAQDNKRAQDDLRDSLADAANAGTSEADAMQFAAIKLRAMEEAAQAAVDAQAKIDEAMTKANTDLARDLEDIDIQTERKRLDIAIEFAQKREDAARKNVDKLEDIQRKYRQEVTDAATDLRRDEEDIARKFGQERIDLERENRQERVEIETSFRQKLQDIQSQFLLDAEEAERKRDAVAFLRLVRERDKKVSEASVDRSREIEQARVTQEQKREELRIAQQRELEEAHITNERKLEDLRLNLERQIEAQNLAHARELEEIAINETRKNEELERNRQQDIEDANRAYQRKLEDLKISLAAEYEAIAANNALIEAENQRHISAMASAGPAPSTTGGAAAGFGATPDTIGGGPGITRPTPRRPRESSRRRASGGSVGAGDYLVGENGPELLRLAAGSSGVVFPDFGAQSSIGSIDNSRSGQFNFPVGNASMFNDPVFVRQLRNLIGAEIGGIL